MKIKTFLISFEEFKKLFSLGEHRQPYRIISGEIPIDAELVNCRMSWECPGQIEIQIKSEQFPPLLSGMVVERFTSLLEKIN